MATISSLTPGTPMEGTYAVRSKQRRLARSGAPFLALTLADATGSVRATIFDEPDFFAAQFEEGDRVQVTGRVGERGGTTEVTLSSLRKVDSPESEGDLLPRSHRDPDELFGFVVHLADEIGHAGLRETLATLTRDEDLVGLWTSVPCTRGGHHAYVGGLVEHTVGVASLCQTLAQWHPRLNPDLLLAAGLVHDIGYTRAWRLGATFELTEEGRLLGHLALGDAIVADAAARSGLGDELALALRHVVAWHHGPPADQPPTSGSPEALALWRINALEAGVKSRLEGGGP